MTSSSHLMIIAGEASGDMRGAELVRAIHVTRPDIRFSGIGGTCMKEAGVHLFENITSLAVIGIVEVIKNLSVIKKVFDHTLRQLDNDTPDAVILVDYPGFNLRLAKEIKRRGIKVIYYISPQVWAWREGRIHKIKQLVDTMIVLFPFEKELYAKYGMDAVYAGHPLIDEVVPRKPPSDVLSSIGLNTQGSLTIGLMPGSREKEITRHLPSLIEAARILYQENPHYQFLLPKAATIERRLLEKYLPKELPIKIYEGAPYDAINAMDAAIVASGTATLETALLKKPMVIIYKTSWITYGIARMVIKIPYIGLVNVVAGGKIVDELIQERCTGGNIAVAIKNAMNDQRLIDDLTQVRTALGEPGAAHRAALAVIKTL